MAERLKPYPTYKYSGLDCLGNVPAHWEVRQLGRMGRFFKGNGGTKADETNEGIPCVRYGDLYTNHSFHITKTRSRVNRLVAETVYMPIEHGDVLFAGSGETMAEIGKSAANLIRGPACCGGDVIVFRAVSAMDTAFLGYATDCLPVARQKARMARGFTVVHIYSTDLKYLSIVVPPIIEQTAIARFLDHATRRIEERIRAKEKLVALLEEQKRALIHGAVTGKIDVRTGRPFAAYTGSGIKWLGRIPAHWQLVRLGRMIDLTVGYPFKSEGFSESEGDVRLLRGINVAPGRIRWDELVRWPVTDKDHFSEYMIEVGDIILGMDRPIVGGGIRVAVAAKTDLPSLLVQRVARVRPAGRRLTPQFAFLLLSSKNFIDYMTPLFTGISVPHLSPGQISAFSIALPNVDEQEQITKYVEDRVSDVQSAMDRAKAQVALLSDYRARLIADVATGKLDVRDAAARLSDEAGDPGVLDHRERPFQ